MKKFIIALTGVAMVAVLLVGCMPAAPEAPPEAAPEVPPVEPVRVGVLWSTPDPARAAGLDQGEYEGIQKVFVEEYGWEVDHAEGIPYGRQAMVLRSFADKDYDIIILTDAGQTPAWFEVAPEYPDIWFIMTTFAEQLPDAERVAAWSFDAFAHGAAAGVTAALLSETNVIGVVSGVPIEVLLVIASGYIEGAKVIKPDIEVLDAWTGDWMDVAKHKELTEVELAKGADVIFCMSASGVKGILEATTAAGVYTVGQMGDIYPLGPETVVTTVAWDTARNYGEIAEQFLAGTLERKITVTGLDGFILCDFHGMVPAQTEAEIRETFRKLQTGEIVVPRVIHEF